MTDCGLYLHIPFCEKRCDYCSFFSSVNNRDVISSYAKELSREIRSLGARNNNLTLKTVYFGGGTPSLLGLGDLEEIFNAIYTSFRLEKPEITIEINPNSSSLLNEYKSFGINRISVGTQSFQSVLLKKLGRIHTPEQALSTLEKAASIFSNVSADIILGIDEKQNPLGELEAVSPFVKHISAYMLTVEEETPLYRNIRDGKTVIASDETMANQYEEFVLQAQEKGFYRYETSNFAIKGYESKHNSSYWNLTPYIGVGAGAHSYLNGRRYYNKTNIIDYMNGVHSGNGKEITERDASKAEDKIEYVMLSLRTVKGVVLSEYRNKFGSEFFSDFNEGIKKSEEYLCVCKESVSILPKYFLVQNAIIRSVLSL